MNSKKLMPKILPSCLTPLSPGFGIHENKNTGKNNSIIFISNLTKEKKAENENFYLAPILC